jgi:transposase
MKHRKQPQLFSFFVYRYRNLVERFFNRLEHFHAVATATTSATTTSSPPSSSPQSAFGSAIMSR